MADTEREERTAVLVVHGMGSQRPLDTVRGIFAAACSSLDDSRAVRGDPPKQYKVWMHPLRSASDIDLPVITLSPADDKGRQFEFHEIYWADLMSETRAVAVLLWLFELARKGPQLPRDVQPLWWGGAVFLSLLILSAAFLLVRAIIWISDIAANTRPLLTVPLLFVAVVAAAACSYARRLRYQLLVNWSLKAIAGAVTLLIGALLLGFFPDITNFVVVHLLPVAIAAFAVWRLMGTQSLKALWFAVVLSVIYSLVAATYWWLGQHDSTQLPEIMANYAAVAACLVIVAYVALNAAYLQPYLGDAARYFRNAPANVEVRRRIRTLAVETLERLHQSGRYDRIVVVAHSLGSVIAYDMLRTYFARVCSALPAGAKLLGEEFAAVDRGVDRDALRRHARVLVARLAQAKKKPAWLVTDFITLGSPLTHAAFLLSTGDVGARLDTVLEQHIAERDFPTCPPQARDGTGYLAFRNPRNRNRMQFHHGAAFGLTRWSNLYFPRRDLLWGDEIGGPLRDVFGDGIDDVEVYTNEERTVDLFAHTSYWDVERQLGRNAPHIRALVAALDLDDRFAPPPAPQHAAAADEGA